MLNGISVKDQHIVFCNYQGHAHHAMSYNFRLIDICGLSSMGKNVDANTYFVVSLPFLLIAPAPSAPVPFPVHTAFET